jgi:hypothetical protein
MITIRITYKSKLEQFGFITLKQMITLYVITSHCNLICLSTSNRSSTVYFDLETFEAEQTYIIALRLHSDEDPVLVKKNIYKMEKIIKVRFDENKLKNFIINQ